jgi:phage terminase small subunit
MALPHRGNGQAQYGWRAVVELERLAALASVDAAKLNAFCL